jgi:hypothetical protein
VCERCLGEVAVPDGDITALLSFPNGIETEPVLPLLTGEGVFEGVLKAMGNRGGSKNVPG